MDKFNVKGTLKVSGISKFVQGQIEKEIQTGNNSIKFHDDVNKLWVCPHGKDYVLVELANDIPADVEPGDTLKIVDTTLKVEKWNSQASNDDSVSKIWQANQAQTTPPHSGKSFSKSTGRNDDDDKNARRRNARQGGFDRRRGLNSEQDIGSGTLDYIEFKLSDDLMQKIEEDVKCNEKLDEHSVKLHQGYLSGTLNAVLRFIGPYMSGSDETETKDDQRRGLSPSYTVFGQSSGPLSSEPGQPASSSTSGFDQLAQNKPPNETFSVNSLFLRYILAYHYEVFEKLESVSKEISFEEKSKCDKDLKITAREKVDRKKFLKIVNEFIDFYQDKHQKMHQEKVLTKSEVDMALISETRLKFTVVVDSTTESDQLMIYGQKDKVLGAKRFLQSKLAGSGADKDLSNATTGKDTATKGATGKVGLIEKLSCEIAKNVKLSVYHGDITKEEVDAIVNPANDRLRHDGGAALAIVKAGGKSIQDDCDKIMMKRGRQPLQISEVEITPAGKLPCKFVLHAVGPIWSNHLPNTAMQLLYNAVYNSLHLACCNGARSISIPAIGSGMYKVPVDVCALVLFDAVIHFTNGAKQPIPLQEIHFVNIDQPTNRTFSQEMEKRFTGLIERKYVETHHSKNSKGQEKEMHSQQSQTAFFLSNSKHPQRPPGTAQRANAPHLGSFSDQSIADKSKGRNSSIDQPPKTLLTYSEATAGKKTGTPDPNRDADDGASKDDECCICLCGYTNKKTLKCSHSFCSECIENAFKVKRQCPICSTVHGPLTGDQPYGRMYDSCRSMQVPGFGSCGTIVISYRIPNGIQGPNHPKPGKPYYGISRDAYLPNNEEGKKVLKLLRKSFDQKLTFTIGRSTTTGREDVVTWNDIHHKTSVYGGPTGYGYPDPDYLKRVQEELAAKGITE